MAFRLEDLEVLNLHQQPVLDQHKKNKELRM